MKLIEGSVWAFVGSASAVCFTSNGFIKPDGSAVMGRGNALEAKERYPGIEYDLGDCLSNDGNIPYCLGEDRGTVIVNFPTKPVEEFVESRKDAEWMVVSYLIPKFQYPGWIPGWALKSSLDVIKESCDQLIGLANQNKWSQVVCPFPGIESGQLPYSMVQDVIKHMDDRFFFVKNTVKV